MYIFKLKISTLSNGAHYGVTPRYDQPSRKVAEVTGEAFHRETWDIEFKFQRWEYDLISERELNTQFTIKAYDKVTNDLEDYVWAGKFTKIDCEFDEDNKTVTVKPRTADRYDNILKSLDKEFDLIALAPEITPVDIVRQPIVQVNVQGSEIISNFLGGVYWETAKNGNFNEASKTGELVAGTGDILIIPGDSSVLNPDVSGTYIYELASATWIRLDNLYYAQLDGLLKWKLFDVATDTLQYIEPVVTVGGIPSDPFAPAGIILDSQTSSSQCEFYFLSIYARLLTNKTTVNGTATTAIPTGDTEEGNANYSRVISLADAGSFTASEYNTIFTGASLHSATATKYNKFDAGSLNFGGEYFVSPGTGYLPIQRNDWKGYGLWFYYNSTIQSLQEDASEDITIKNGYKLPDVLKVLLNEIDSDITHLELNEYSNFFYGSNSIRTSRRYPIISPKSNIIVGQYDQPASKAPIKLSDVLNMLKYVYNAYWYIDADLKFMIEHINYFENGGQYYFPNVGVDLTTLLEPKTGKPWGYRLNKYTYDRQDIPERITTKWMDNQSFAFDGEPIICISNYAEAGNLEERTIGLFSADVDYIMANANDISKDGFVLFDTQLSGGVYSLPFVNLAAYGYTGVKTQNGYLSLAWLLPNYHKYNLPVYTVNINGVEEPANSVRRTKVQEIEFAAFAFDEMELITTELGTGKIKEFEQVLTSDDSNGIKYGAIKGTIKHDIT